VKSSNGTPKGQVTGISVIYWDHGQDTNLTFNIATREGGNPLISSGVGHIAMVQERFDGIGIYSLMTPHFLQPKRCDIDAQIGIAPTGFSKEPLGAALAVVELESNGR
jgi:hypothetical protein